MASLLQAMGCCQGDRCLAAVTPEAQPYLLACSSWHQAALEHWVNDRVDELITSLEQERKAVLDCQLKLLKEIRIMEGFDLQCSMS
jgi:hypothetical protein